MVTVVIGFPCLILYKVPLETLYESFQQVTSMKNIAATLNKKLEGVYEQLFSENDGEFDCRKDHMPIDIKEFIDRKKLPRAMKILNEERLLLLEKKRNGTFCATINSGKRIYNTKIKLRENQIVQDFCECCKSGTACIHKIAILLEIEMQAIETP